MFIEIRDKKVLAEIDSFKKMCCHQIMHFKSIRMNEKVFFDR